MKWILLFALSAPAFGAQLVSTPETDVIEVARLAAEPALVKTYARWVNRHHPSKDPKRKEPWLKGLAPTSTTKNAGGDWLVVWLDEPPAGWFVEAHVSVSAKGEAKVLKARAGFASQ